MAMMYMNIASLEVNSVFITNEISKGKPTAYEMVMNMIFMSMKYCICIGQGVYAVQVVKDQTFI